MSKISVIIADDHRLIREGIKLLLKENNEIELVAETEDGFELLEKVRELEPDVVLLDVSMPRMDGITAITKILDEYPDTGIIMLSMHEEPEFVRKCAEAGALSYLLKNVSRVELIQTIKKVAVGERTFNPVMSELLLRGLDAERKIKRETIKISKRELEVIECLAKGMSTKQMAVKLFLSVRTIESHRLRLLRKFDAQNATELVRTAIEKKMVTI
jgi:two-component system response regulator NreC